MSRGILLGLAVLLGALGALVALGQKPVPVVVVPRALAPVRVQIVLPIGAAEPWAMHYVEHLVWLTNLGKAARSENRDTNAWTSETAVGYWLSGPPEDLPAMLRQLRRVFEPLTLPRETAETERDILLREYDLRIGADLDARVAAEMRAFLFAGHALAGAPIGTPEQIATLRYEAAKVLQAQSHRAERAQLVVTGDVSEAEVLRAMKAVQFPALATDPQAFAPQFTLAAPLSRHFRYPAPNAAARMVWRRVVALPAPVDFDLLSAQTALTRDILDTNLPGGLAGPLRFDAFVARTFALSLQPIDAQHIELIFAAEPDQGIGFAALQAAFEAALAASAQGVPRATYERVHQRFAGSWPDWADAEARARWMEDYALTRAAQLRRPKTARQMQNIAAQLDAQSVNALLAALAGGGRTAIAFIGPEPAP